ncbi:hypothetical protein ACFLQ8_00440 [Candidatus Auribacterota bacterium]
MRALILKTFVLLALLGAAARSYADIDLLRSDQDGFVNDKEYSRRSDMIIVGKRDFIGVFEFELKSKRKLDKAILVLNVEDVRKPGEFALYHLLSFNNGRAEVQDFFAAGDLVRKVKINGKGPLQFDITKAVNQDISGPGMFTSYKLVPVDDGEIIINSFDSGKDCAVIRTEP